MAEDEGSLPSLPAEFDPMVEAPPSIPAAPPLPTDRAVPPPLPGNRSVAPAVASPRSAAPPRKTGAPPRQGAFDRARIQSFLLTTPLFDDDKVARGVAERAEVKSFAAGATILRAGIQSLGMGFIVSGKATVYSVDASSGEKTALQTLKKGEHFGEVSELAGVAQPYQVDADEPCVVLLLSAEVFELLMKRVPGFSQSLAKRLAKRLVLMGVRALRSGGGASDEAAPKKGDSDADEIRFVEVGDYRPSRQTLGAIPQKMILRHRLIPLKLTNTTLIVGMVNPRHDAAITELKRYLHRVTLEVVAISMDDYAQSLVHYKLHGKEGEGARAEPVNPEALQFDIIDSEREADKAVRVIGDEVVRAINKILATAIQREASDVHIEPTNAGVQVRFRIHGHLETSRDYLPASFAPGLSTRLKILSGLDITERRVPQEGRIGITIGRREVDMRVSMVPASRGEKIVLRLFEEANMTRPLDRIFLEKGMLQAVRDSLSRSAGAVLVSGGTGSGKSTTLYSLLTERKKTLPDTNVMMVEDPIEYRMQGITQIQVNPAVNLGFSEVLRAMLRQDPDVIAIGETRDGRTASTALEAAMTGHLLLTTIHATDAISALQRLEGLGCSRELVAQSMSILIAQRLSRRLCPACGKSEKAAPLLYDNLVARRLVEKGAQVKLPRAVGCDQCANQGYVGRVPVLESLVINEQVRESLMTNQPLTEVERVAKETKALHPYHRYASALMARNLISAVDALMVVAG